MSDPLKGLKPTPGPYKLKIRDVECGRYAELLSDHAPEFDGKTQPVAEIATSQGHTFGEQQNTDALLITDAFNAYTATGLAPSQLASERETLGNALVDERAISAAAIRDRDEARALNAELVKVLESVLNDAEHNEMTGGYDVQSQNRALAESLLARAKAGAR